MDRNMFRLLEEERDALRAVELRSTPNSQPKKPLQIETHPR